MGQKPIPMSPDEKTFNNPCLLPILSPVSYTKSKRDETYLPPRDNLQEVRYHSENITNNNSPSQIFTPYPLMAQAQLMTNLQFTAQGSSDQKLISSGHENIDISNPLSNINSTQLLVDEEPTLSDQGGRKPLNKKFNLYGLYGRNHPSKN